MVVAELIAFRRRGAENVPVEGGFRSRKKYLRYFDDLNHETKDTFFSLSFDVSWGSESQAPWISPKCSPA